MQPQVLPQADQEAVGLDFAEEEVKGNQAADAGLGDEVAPEAHDSEEMESI